MDYYLNVCLLCLCWYVCVCVFVYVCVCVEREWTRLNVNSILKKLIKLRDKNSLIPTTSTAISIPTASRTIATSTTVASITIPIAISTIAFAVSFTIVGTSYISVLLAFNAIFFYLLQTTLMFGHLF